MIQVFYILKLGREDIHSEVTRTYRYQSMKKKEKAAVIFDLKPHTLS